ncbi:MAG: chromate transporter [Eubacteriaceae bacterium]|nr:chromate transporter [Eubacteriaceae bacterium]
MSVIWQLFITFFKIGLFTIGGGYAMIPFIQQEVVQKGWVSITDVMDFIAVSESTPGPFAVNISTFCGITAHGFLGAAAATIGVVLPSFLIILFIAKKSSNILCNKYVRYSLDAIRPAIVGLILYVVFEFMKLSLFTSGSPGFSADIKALIIFIFLAGYFIFRTYKKKKVNPITIILLSAFFGIVMYGVLPILNL